VEGESVSGAGAEQVCTRYIQREVGNKIRLGLELGLGLGLGNR